MLQLRPSGELISALTAAYLRQKTEMAEWKTVNECAEIWNFSSLHLDVVCSLRSLVKYRVEHSKVK